MAARTLQFKPFQTLANATEIVVQTAHSLPFGRRRGASPTQVFLEGVIVPGWRVQEPLVLSVERDEEGSFIISDALFDVYGVGQTREDALDDYVVSLVEYYEIIAAHALNDVPTARLLDRLRIYLIPDAA